MLVRLQKLIADAGIASRRASEDLIRDGRVRINGRRVTELGTRADPEQDRVTIDGKPVRPRPKLYLALHKPRGYICSKSDPGGRPLVDSLLPAEWRHVVPVGRLDFDSEGLLLLTNDGEFCLRLTHPRFEVRKRYRVILRQRASPDDLHQLLRGIWSDGERLKAVSVRPVEDDPSGRTVDVELAEGKNREIRRMFMALGHDLSRLKRTQIGPLTLGRLSSGEWRKLKPAEIRALMQS